MPRSHLAPFVVAACLVAFAPIRSHAAPPAPADAKKQCVSAYGESQRLKRDGKLRDAREQLIICAQVSCPASLRNECVPWLSQVEAAMPSVVVEARDLAGRETIAVQIAVDGTLLANKADGRSIDVDPGEHAFRYEFQDKVIEEKLVIREGEKHRKLHVDFSKLAAPPAASSSSPPAVEEPPPPSPLRKVPLLTWILGGVGVAALGSFTAFAVVGKGKENELKSDCAPNCSRSGVDTMRRDYLIADISLGLGIVALGGAAYFMFARPKEKPPASSAFFAPAPGGGVLSLQGTF
jgi:hypothetical protein